MCLTILFILSVLSAISAKLTTQVVFLKEFPFGTMPRIVPFSRGNYTDLASDIELETFGLNDLPKLRKGMETIGKKPIKVYFTGRVPWQEPLVNTSFTTYKQVYRTVTPGAAIIVLSETALTEEVYSIISSKETDHIQTINLSRQYENSVSLKWETGNKLNVTHKIAHEFIRTPDYGYNYIVDKYDFHFQKDTIVYRYVRNAFDPEFLIHLAPKESVTVKIKTKTDYHTVKAEYIAILFGEATFNEYDSTAKTPKPTFGTMNINDIMSATKLPNKVLTHAIIQYNCTTAFEVRVKNSKTGEVLYSLDTDVY